MSVRPDLCATLSCCLLLASCGGDLGGEGDVCGPNQECLPRFVCDGVASRCVRAGEVQIEAADAAAAEPADAAAAVEPPTDAAAVGPADAAAVEPPADAAVADAVAVQPPADAASVDHTAPVVTITSGPRNQTVGPEVTFRYAASEPATFTCTLGGPSIDCAATGKTYRLETGSYTFSVMATDLAGNASKPATAKFSVDADGPALDISSPGEVAMASGTLAFAAEDPSPPIAFRCAFNGATLAACASGDGYSGLEPGENTLVVVARDALGNATRVMHSFTVEAKACVLYPDPCQSDEDCCFGTSCDYPLPDGQKTCRIYIP